MQFKLNTQIFDVFGESVDNNAIHDLFSATDTDLDRQFRQAETKLGSEGIGNKYGIPAKEELLKYARVEYYEETQYTAAMAQLLDKELHISDWRRKLLEIILNLRLDNYNIQDFIDTLDAEIPGFDIAQNAIDVYTKLHNNTRLMANRGYTPDELSRKYNPQGALPTSISFGPGIQRLIQSGEMNADELMKGFEAMRIPQDLKSSLITETEKAKQSKPGRNDPCPCGSGKKYKKCCGR